jgi:dTDP-4-dehydrorhamnose reductase
VSAPAAMKVLIVGAGGQVGRALVTSAPLGAEVVALSHAQLDMGDARAVAQAVRQHAPDVVINAAGYTAVDRAEAEPEAARRANADGPGYLAASARDLGARLLHISTDYVFDGTASVPYLPESATNAVSVYGQTKLAGENAVRRLPPGRSVIVRTAWLYAAQGHNFVNTMLRVMWGRGPVRVVTDQLGAPTAAGSLAAALWRVVDRPEIVGIHHWTDAGIASWYDFAVAIAEEATTLGVVPAGVSVVPVSSREYSTPARRPAYSVLDCSSLRTLGLAPVHWRQRLRTVLAEIRGG